MHVDDSCINFHTKWDTIGRSSREPQVSPRDNRKRLPVLSSVCISVDLIVRTRPHTPLPILKSLHRFIDV